MRNGKVPAPMEQYRHFKGKLYQVLALAKDAGTNEDVVVYQGLYPPFAVWTRPLREFTEELDPGRYPRAGQRYRFERIDGGAAGQEAGEESAVSRTEESGNMRIDPQVEAFLDARTVEEKLGVLASLRTGVTDAMIDTMAIAAGVEIGPGEVQDRLRDLKECLMTKARYEQHRGNRL